MSKFPLFDNLSKDIPNRDLLLAEKRLFIKNIEEIDKNDESENIFIDSNYSSSNDSNTNDSSTNDSSSNSSV